MRVSSAPPAVAGPRTPVLSTEEWVGQRGILAAGVILVILAAGFFLKFAFDRGWVSPAMRVVGGVIMGGATASVGWRLHPRFRTYGAAIIGLGFGIIYLALWAAATIYGLIPAGLDIAALTLVSLALAVVAFVLDEEALGVAAATGAFFAPVVIGSRGNPDALLLYLAMVGATLGAASIAKRWRKATFVVALAMFGLGLVGAFNDATPWRVALFAMSGAAGIAAGLWAHWPETRILSFAGGWGLLAAAASNLTWLVTVTGVVLTAPLWWHAFRTSHIWPDPRVTGESDAVWLFDETVPFYLTPVFLGWAITYLSPTWFAGHPGIAAFVVAVAYVAVGYQKPRYPFTLVGAAAAAWATIAAWPSFEAVYVLLALSLLWAGLDHWLGRNDGRWYAAGTVAVAILQLAQTAGVLRGIGPAFVDGWAGALWFTIIVAGILAQGLWMRVPGVPPTLEPENQQPPRDFTQAWIRGRDKWADQMPTVLWTIAGALLFAGVTGELDRFFRQSGIFSSQAELWSGLSISAWWATFAGGLVALGFRRNIRPARVAGLIVAGIAVAKVILIDLSKLDALYRVGSVFILGVVSLLVAFLYHRQAKLKP